MAAFAVNDRVAWDHGYSTQHGEGSVVKATVVQAYAPGARLGTVTAIANDVETYFDVLLDGDTEARTLTVAELVKVSNEEDLEPAAPAPEAPAEEAPAPEAPADPAPEAPVEAAPDA